MLASSFDIITMHSLTQAYPSLNRYLFKELQAIQRPVQSGTGQYIDVLYTIQL